jgi:hypothetical protein
MRGTLRRYGTVAATLIAIAGTTAVPQMANARWGGGWHGGGWHGGGWGWGGFGVGLGTGLLLGAATAPYYGGYYGYGPYAYDYGYSPYAYGYGPYAYGYDGGCQVRGQWVWDGYGHRVWRHVRVCY